MATANLFFMNARNLRPSRIMPRDVAQISETLQARALL